MFHNRENAQHARVGAFIDDRLNQEFQDPMLTWLKFRFAMRLQRFLEAHFSWSQLTELASAAMGIASLLERSQLRTQVHVGGEGR